MNVYWLGKGLLEGTCTSDARSIVAAYSKPDGSCCVERRCCSSFWSRLPLALLEPHLVVAPKEVPVQLGPQKYRKNRERKRACYVCNKQHPFTGLARHDALIIHSLKNLNTVFKMLALLKSFSRSEEQSLSARNYYESFRHTMQPLLAGLLVLKYQSPNVIG